MAKLNQISEYLVRTVYANLPLPEVSKPTFIIGMGRSGTTILGKALAKHSQVTYLNEPRNLWIQYYPKTDIWSSLARKRQGKLWLTAEDTNAKNSKKLRRLFHFKTISKKGPFLIEKLPINCFRLNFIHAIFPDARFIYLNRNGLEVAKSIQKMSENGAWFGNNEYKWRLLKEFAESCESTKELPEQCTTFYNKGLLEWRCSNEAALAFFKSIPKNSYFELNYENLINSPVETLTQVLNFIGLDSESSLEKFAENEITRRSENLSDKELTAKEKTIGGELLQMSLNPQNKLTEKS